MTNYGFFSEEMFQTTLKIFAYISDISTLFSTFLPCKCSGESTCTVLAEGVTWTKLNASDQISSFHKLYLWMR